MRPNLSDDRRLPDWLVQNRNFVLLWAAYGIAAVGDHLSEMALLVERDALGGDRSVRIAALLSFGFFLPFVVFGPIAGWWADRFSRKTTMIAADLMRAGVVISFIVVVPWLATRFGEGPSGDYSVMLPLMGIGLIAAFFSPARQAMLPTLIRQDQLVRANAMISALGTIGGILGFTIGGYIVARGTVHAVRWNYMINALTYATSAVLIFSIFPPRRQHNAPTEQSGMLQPLIEGFRYVGCHRRVLQMILLGSLFWGAAGVVIACVPDIVKEIFGGGYQDIGTYRGIIIIGLATGAAVLTVLGASIPLPLAVLLGLLGATFWLTVLDITYIAKLGRLLTAICLFGLGGAGATLLVTVMATIQRFVPNQRRGRVFGVSDTCTMGAMVAASAALGLPSIPHLDYYVPYLIGGTALAFAVGVVVAWRIYRRTDPHPRVLSTVWRFVELYGRFWCGVKRAGPCTIPREGPVILACNHTAGVDPIAVFASYRHRVVSFLVERTYYNKPVANWFMRLVRCVPIDRENPGRSFMTSCLRILEDGGCVGIFPQGTYAPPEEPEPAPLPGVGALALRSGAAVIPCHISGTTYAHHPLRSYFKRHRIRIRYGRPVDLGAFAGREKDPSAPQAVADLIMREIRALAPSDGATDDSDSTCREPGT